MPAISTVASMPHESQGPVPCAACVVAPSSPRLRILANHETDLKTSVANLAEVRSDCTTGDNASAGGDVEAGTAYEGGVANRDNDERGGNTGLKQTEESKSSTPFQGADVGACEKGTAFSATYFGRTKVAMINSPYLQVKLDPQKGHTRQSS